VIAPTVHDSVPAKAWYSFSPMRILNLLLFSSFVLLVALPSVAEATKKKSSWEVWEAELQRQCPANHVDWVFDGYYLDLLNSFEETLPALTRQKIFSIADYSRLCAQETMGFSCKMGASLDAFNRLGLMKQFVVFGCRHYKCEEPALCSLPKN
jgi:hypothetical protein